MSFICGINEPIFVALIKLNAANTKPTSLYAIISKNSLTIFKCKAAVTVSKEKKQASSSWKERVQLYSSHYIKWESRQGDLDEFFQLENHEYPPTLSDYGKIRKPTAKSDFLKRMYQEKGRSGDEVLMVLQWYRWMPPKQRRRSENMTK